MVLKTLFTTHMLEVTLILISTYFWVKAWFTRKISSATKAFWVLTTANFFFQLSNLFMVMYRKDAFISGVAAGWAIYIMGLIMMVTCAYLWLNYVEEAIGSKLLNTRKKKLIAAIPAIAFIILCFVSIKTEWVLKITPDSEYKIGSMFLMQYLFILIYVVFAMVHSIVNYCTSKERRSTDKMLLGIMVVDAVASGLQIVYADNFMAIALTFTIVLTYINVHTQEIQTIKETLAEERRREKAVAAERELVAQNSERLFALEDDFESLYDVEIESGHYEYFVKGAFYKDNVIDKLATPRDYFEELRANIKAVIYEEDQEALHNKLTRDGIAKELANNDHYDHYYRLNIEGGLIWFKMRVVYKDSTKKNIIIGVFNAQEEMAAKEKDIMQLAQTEVQLRHEKLRREILDQMMEQIGNPIDVLRNYAEEMRELIGCDQVVYRDLEETRIMVNSDGIAKTWSVPLDYCKQCEHFNAHHPMYAGGYTEMENCQEGWQGIPVYSKCPIKSSLTRIVYCDGEVAGYLAIHYVQNYHKFTNLERETVAMFARILSISISRYEAQKKAAELGGIKKTLNMMFSLSSEYDPIIVIDPETGEYDWYQSKASEIEELTSMSIHGENLYKNIAIDSEAIIHEEDRAQYQQFYTKENMLQIAASGESQSIENRWKVGPNGEYLWKYNKAVRMIDDTGKTYVAVGVIDTTETKKKEEMLRESVAFTNFFLDTYESAYYVNLENLKCNIYKIGKIPSKNDTIDDYVEAFINHIMHNTHPEDRQELIDFIQPDNIKSELKKTQEISLIFRDIGEGKERYLKLQIIRGGDAQHVAFGFSDITGEIIEQNARQAEREATQKLISSISATYSIAYTVNLKTNECRLLRKDDKIIGANQVMQTFESSTDFFMTLLEESDRKFMSNELDFDTIRKKLKENKSYSVEFRMPINNAMTWQEMNVTMVDPEKELVAIGFINRDMEITQRHIEGKRYEEYFAIYEVDIDSDTMKIVKDSPTYGIDRVGKAYPFRETITKFAAGLDAEPREFFEKFADLEYAKERFSYEDKFTYEYRSNYIGDKCWVECAAYVTYRHQDGTPAMFAFTFSLLDSLGINRQELQVKYKEALNVVSEEKARNDMLHEIIHSGKWSFKVTADDKVTEAYYSKEAMAVVNNDFSTGVTDWTDIIHPDDKEAALRAFTATIMDHSGNTPYDIVFRMHDRNNEYHWFHSAGRMLRYEDGSGEFFGIHIDITPQIEEQLRQQKQLEEARIAADAANRAKTQFLFSMSHDIRTPLNAICGFTTMAKKRAGDEQKVVEYLNKIDLSGQQLLTLINEVLEMARIESGKMELEQKHIDVEKEFKSMTTVLEEQAKNKGITFKHSLDNIKHDKVIADEARMSSITLNIAGNAIKYTPEGGSVEFKLEEIESRKPGYATYKFIVSDTGIGMSQEYLKDLYKPFSRAKTSTVSRIQGTGLGLSIVKSTVDLMGGSIDVQSELGKGTKFEVVIDCKIDEEGAILEEKDTDKETDILKGHRVLLVEDNELNREIGRDILEEVGLIVDDADDGDVAVEKIKKALKCDNQECYDFVLMDIQMPRMDGHEATKAIRALPGGKKLPIIAVSANAFEEDVKKSLESGMNGHIAKPIDIKALLRTLRKLIKK